MRRLLFLIPVAGLVLGAAGAPAASAVSGGHPLAGAGYVFSGSAFGTVATVGDTVTSGRSAPVEIGCTSDGGVRRSNSSAGVDVSPLMKTATVSTSAASHRSPVSEKSLATVQGVTLLDGVITATAVRAASSTKHTASRGFSTSAAGTTFTSLVVAGVPVSGTVDPDTRIDVPGFGYVIVNEQSGRVGNRVATLTVNALHLVITQANALGIAVGTNVVVSHALSGLSGPAVAAVDGFGYGTRVNAAGDLSTGPSFRVSLPCSGTNGRVKTNQGAGVNVPGVLVTGAIHDTAQGTVTASDASAETTATVDDATVLDSLVQATTITADAHASSNGSTTAVSDSGSGFATLVVRGYPGIGPDTPPNTRVRIVGLGILWLHRVMSTPSSIEVRMIELIVTNPNNAQGLPVGADVRIAVARAATR